MGDREKLVKTIADTLRKELTIDAPPQRVTSSVNTRKTRSHPKAQASPYNTVLLLDANIWDRSALQVVEGEGNANFFKGILKTLLGTKRKVYTVKSSFFLGFEVYSSTPVHNSSYLKDYVFSPLGIEVVPIEDSELESVDSALWLPLFRPRVDINFSEGIVNVLKAKAKKFGLILQGEHALFPIEGFDFGWRTHNNYYLKTFYQKLDWEFPRTSYTANWTSREKNSKNMTITAGLNHGIPMTELHSQSDALATFTVRGIEYAGAIAWRMK